MSSGVSFTEYRVFFEETLKSLNEEEINDVLLLLKMAKKQKRSIYVIGNGGSAMNASHFAQDLSKACGISAKSLAENISLITAVANDVSYDVIFVEQLSMKAKKDDILFSISGSGNSPNVLRATEWANDHGLSTVGVTGFDGGFLKPICDYSLHVPLNDMATAESVHSFILHYLVIKLTR